MTPGDPFETKDLDALRSRQRRLLRSIPDYEMVKGCKNRPAPREFHNESDRALVETKLRELALFLLAEIDDGLPERMQRSEEWSGLPPYLEPGRDTDLDMGDLLQELQGAAQDLAGPRISPEERKQFRKVALVLAMADDLTDYVDPRLR